jgi:DNA-directed RNA polymerase subunit H (RpoH/RPB5)
LPIKKRRKKEVKKIVHFLVPKHELVKPDGEKEILEKFGITKKDLPRIKDYDPAIQGLDAKEGDIIRILRENDESVYYRVVVR